MVFDKKKHEKYLLHLIEEDKKEWENSRNSINVEDLKEKTEYNDWFIKQMNLSEKDIFIDVGCAFGGLLAKAAKKCKYVVGVDIAEYMIKNTIKMLKDEKVNLISGHPKDAENIEEHSAFVLEASAHDLPFEENTFDKISIKLDQNISLADETHHGELMQKYIKEAARVLKENGFIYYFFDANSKGSIPQIEIRVKTQIFSSLNKKLKKKEYKLKYIETKKQKNSEYLCELRKMGQYMDVSEQYQVLFKFQKVKL
ncbi:MAG: class I SAM-dependent methyltransferase [Candidatus Undinarchaeales archaeon]|jgi:ubiquinone/menaquinone biosynthesis C-methylase UbiE|nr:class I SAM-dependent methyltransferase [Candidatus Undinarchaeales archaeon]